MENYFYKCEKCGFVHIVPAYWVSYCPEESVELEHLDLKTGEECSIHHLMLVQSTDEV